MKAIHHFILIASVSLIPLVARTHAAQTGQSSAPGQSASASQPANEWPQTTTDNGVTYTLNQPSFTAISQNVVTLTSAMTVKQSNGTTAIGTATMTATMVPAEVAGLVELSHFSVSGIAGINDPTAPATLTTLLTNMAFTVPLSALVQDITLDATRSSATLSNSPPAIVVTNTPTMLVSVAGAPVLAPLASTTWQKVINTPFILLKSADGRWWVRLGKANWMNATSLNGPFGLAASAPPTEVVTAIGPMPATPEGLGEDIDRVGAPLATPPSVIVATRPTVLVSINGGMQTEPIRPGLNKVTNASQTMFIRTAPPTQWVLASGRWFSSNSTSGPWVYVPPSELPAEFKQIKAGDDDKLSAALASVPGTNESNAAIVNAGLVRTAVLSRATAVCVVNYNGSPAFADVQGTAMQYATNSNQPVIQSGSNFYCCDNAAWFVANSATGPWALCDTVPASVYSIPPSCPVYSCTYVEVYGSTADSVTFGFTGGYMNTFVQDGAIVYGTGYDYPTTTAADQTIQVYPQTYGMQAAYDQDSGIFAPPSESDFYGYYPSVYPNVLNDGWDGWGWYEGGTVAYGWGYGNWGHWNQWNDSYRHWNPYYNHWNNGLNGWSHNEFNHWNQVNRDANIAARNNTPFNTARNWNRGSDTNAGAHNWTNVGAADRVGDGDRANNLGRANDGRFGGQRSGSANGASGFHNGYQNAGRPGGSDNQDARGGGGGMRGGGGGRR